MDDLVREVAAALVAAVPPDSGLDALGAVASALAPTAQLGTGGSTVPGVTEALGRVLASSPIVAAAGGGDVSRARSRSPRGALALRGAGVMQVEPIHASPVPDGCMEVPGITDRRFEGTITSVHPEKGCGFIQCLELREAFQNKDIFIHRAHVGGFKAGDVVSFSVVVYIDGKPQAKDLRDARRPVWQSNGEITHSIPLEADIIGALVGKRGGSILELQRKAGGGVHIQVQPPIMQGGPQTCNVSGPRANADAGRKLVMDRIHEIKRQRAIFEGPKPPQDGTVEEVMVAPPAQSETDLEFALSNWDITSLANTGRQLIEQFTTNKALDPVNAMTLGIPGPEGEVTHFVLVEGEIVGSFVGKQGQCIMDLQRKAGAGVHIQIQPPTTEGGPQLAEITGPQHSADVGVLLVRQKVDELKHQKTVHDRLKNEGLVPGGHVTHWQPNVAPGLNTDEAFNERSTFGPGGQSTYEIDVPFELVGALVGKRGSVIMELQASCGTNTHIQIHPPVMQGGAQVCEVTGPVQAAQWGAQLVKDKLVEIREARIINDRARRDQGRPVLAPNPAPYAAPAVVPIQVPRITPGQFGLA